MKTTITITEEQLAATFAEWERRWREEPERFQAEAQRLAESAESYGQGAAAYFIQIFEESTPPPDQVLGSMGRYLFGRGGQLVDLGEFARRFNDLPDGYRKAYKKSYKRDEPLTDEAA